MTDEAGWLRRDIALACCVTALQDQDVITMAAPRALAGELVSALADAEGVIGGWTAFLDYGLPEVLMTSGAGLLARSERDGWGDLLVMVSPEDADVLSVALGVAGPAERPRVRVVAREGQPAEVPALLTDAVIVADGDSGQAGRAVNLAVSGLPGARIYGFGRP